MVSVSKFLTGNPFYSTPQIVIPWIYIRWNVDRLKQGQSKQPNPRLKWL